MGLPIVLVFFCLAFYLPGLTTLPPIDRDEARFAQATSQMLEEGDFVRIWFQDEARNKKPIGIHWLQAASVALSETLPSRRIWPYRIPSLLGAVCAVLLTFAAGKRMFGERRAFLGAALCAGSLLLVVEAHQATTDAVLLATVVAAQGALARYYLRADPEQPPGAGAFATFWIAQAAGILVKGPIPPLVSLLTIGCLVSVDRNFRWLKGLRPFRGISIVAVAALPWALAIGIATNWAFFHDAIGGDLLSKVASGQESHGFPPGYYLLLMPLTLWPASLLAGAALVRAWRSRSNRAVRFCLAWIVPAWLLFELVPTKLPHYILPVYPALCLLVADAAHAGVEGKAPELRSLPGRLGFVSCSLVILVLVFGAATLPLLLERRLDGFGLFSAAAAAGVAWLSIRCFLRGHFPRAMLVAVAGTALVLGPVLQWSLPGLDSLWLSRSAAREAREYVRENNAGEIPLASAGYHEPSLVFLLGTRTALTSPGKAAAFLEKHPGGLALVSAGGEDGQFRREAERLGLPISPVGGPIRGFCYSKGKNMVLQLYGLKTEPREF